MLNYITHEYITDRVVSKGTFEHHCLVHSGTNLEEFPLLKALCSITELRPTSNCTVFVLCA